MVFVWLLMRQVIAAAAAPLCSRPASGLPVDTEEEALVGALLGLRAEVAIGFSVTMLPLFVIAIGLAGIIMADATIIGLMKVAPRKRCLEGAAPVYGPGARPLAAEKVWRAPGLRASLALGLAHARCPGARP